MTFAGAIARMRTSPLRRRLHAVVHHDRIAISVDDAAERAQRVLSLYRDSFPKVFGPCAGRRVGERTPEPLS